MKIKLADHKMIWGLQHPIYFEYLKPSGGGRGFAAECLVLTQNNPGPVEIAWNKQPEWAKKVLLYAIQTGDIICTEGLEELSTPKEVVVETPEEIEIVESQSKTKGKKRKAKA